MCQDVVLKDPRNGEDGEMKDPMIGVDLAMIEQIWIRKTSYGLTTMTAPTWASAGSHPL